MRPPNQDGRVRDATALLAPDSLIATVTADVENRAAACRHDAPASTGAIIRFRKSNKAPAMLLPLIQQAWNHGTGSRATRSMQPDTQRL